MASNKEKWTADRIPDQKGRVVIVTGSSSGIGYEAARVLANKNATVVIAVRNMEKGNTAANKIRKENGNADLHIMELDLADFESINSFPAKFSEKFDRLDLLINNAGVMIPPYSKTADGFELQFGTNHLGHFLLTNHLLPVLEKTENSRIINIASSAHRAGNLNFDDLNWENRKYIAWKAYGDSKIANLYFTYELAKRLEKAGSKVKVTAAHPGWTATELQRHSGLFSFLNNFFAMSVEQGTLPTLRAAIDEDANNGDYYGPDGWQEWKGWPVKVKSTKLSYSKEIAEKLWTVSEELTKSKFNVG